VRHAWIVLGLSLGVGWGCNKTTKTSSSPSLDEQAAAEDAAAPMDAREAAQWVAAAQGEPEELMRLVDRVGCSGVRDRATQGDLRRTALRAMQYCPDLSELAWLAAVAAGPGDEDARAALETIDALAARPRRATDPEDAEEVHDGCATLLGLVRDPSRPKERRLLAVRALRMLTDRGCAAPPPSQP
jgi:hypothetical protein